MNRKREGFAFAAALLLAGAPAWAANGHLLHGVGAVNSSMGGAGVALPNDALGALTWNPALLTRLDGHKMEFSAEYNTAHNAVESQVGPFSGRTEEQGDPSLIPAFGWTAHRPGSRLALGMGFLGLAGFGVDYPQTQGNPLLSPQPAGFGRVYSNYAFMKVPVALAFQVTDSLSLGASLNAGRATLTADPAGFTTPDCSSPASCFVPSVNNDSAFGFGVTVGMLYDISDRLSFGLSYATEQDFEEFEWHTSVANPNLPTFGRDRVVRFKLNAPPMLSAGIGFRPTDRVNVALDGRWVNYESTDGFEDALGFKDMTVIALGLQFRASDKLTLRLGGNHSDSPIESDRVFFTVPVPAVFEDRVTAGLGFRVYENLQANLAYYHVFENRVSGPIFSPATGPIPGSRVTTEMAMDSLVATFSFDL